MNHLRRIFAAVARLPVLVVATKPAAFNAVPSPGELGSSCAPGPVRAIAGGRMPGWQITLTPLPIGSRRLRRLPRGGEA